MGAYRMSRISTGFCTFLLASTALVAVPSMAQTADTLPQSSEEDTGAGEIIVTGTRAVGQLAAESAAPIQLLSEDSLARVGQPNLNQALTQLVPSFQTQTQGTDMASFSLSARLRGVSPNHTLVLVNGKRRHGNSILQVINGAFGGSAAPSIDLIPPDIVKRIEILQDGAAAQYGSDAIAGVINIILKSDTSGGSFKATAGQYADGEGTSYSASGNLALPISDNGYLNVTLFHRRNDFTKVGDGQFTVRALTGVTATNVSAAFQPLYNALNARNGTANINGGQPKSSLTLGFYNFGYDFGGVEFYSFGDISYRQGDALQGYRVPNRICRDPITARPQTSDPTNCFGNTAANGLVPHILVDQNEFQVTNGFKGTAAGWDFDLAGSYSEDKSKIYTVRRQNI
jgi:iron complex outermembrane receptor protein